MKIILGCDINGFELKEYLKRELSALGYEIIDGTVTPDYNFIDAADVVCKAVLSGEAERGILIDDYGTGSFMAAVKHKGIICAELADEHSAFMTRQHNNTSVVALGSQISGKKQALALTDCFLKSKYCGGRHQIRVDMLNKMC